MTTTLEPTRRTVELVTPQLPRSAPLIAGAVSLALGGLVAMLLGHGPVLAVFLGVVLFAIALPSWSYAVEGRRNAVDRLMTTLVWGAFGLALAPLVSLVWTVIARGAPAINQTFLTFSMFRTDLSQPVGIYHALIGTLLVTLFTALISVPIGIFTAIYLWEYDRTSRLSRWITFLIDVMTGIPSIVAGLFAFSMFTLLLGPAYRSGIGGSVALSLLMIPVVVRSTEEMLRLVPADLREAAYALGVPKWRTIVRVVLPTALGGIVTGVTLATARVVGETAPLLLICGLTTRTNFNVFHERMTTLPVLIYTQNANPGIAPPGGTPPGVQMAWGAALVLIVIVMTLNLVARAIGRMFAPPKST
jgi:phosphate transport system permease protein